MRARVGSRSFRRARSNIPKFKIISAAIIIALYFFVFRTPPPKPKVRTPIQLEQWHNGTGLPDADKSDAVVAAMKHTYSRYKEKAWGSDGIKPISGGKVNDRNGWGCFIVDSSTTLALMGLWDELAYSVNHIISIDFNQTDSLVDPFEATIRYLGALVSLVDLIDVGVVPGHVVSKTKRNEILDQAVTLSAKLAPAYDSTTGIPYARVDFIAGSGVPDPPEVRAKYTTPSEHTTIGPARAGTNILEHRTLSRLTSDESHTSRSLKSWSALVWNRFNESFAGMVDGRIDAETSTLR